MCATKLFTMRTPTEEHLHKPGELAGSDQDSSKNFKAFSSFHSDHHLLSRQSGGGYVRNPSVPNLLNVESRTNDTSAEQQSHVSSYWTTVSRGRAPNVTLAVETSPLSKVPPHDSGGNFITPPSSTTRVQFKTPVWKGGFSEQNDVESSSTFQKSGMTPTRHRQSSMESLMRAAATVEGDIDLNKSYQDKVATIIELKNKISETIRNWPIAKDSISQEDVSTEKPLYSGEPSNKILLDQISCKNLYSLDEITGSLGNTVKELVNLKKHVRYLRESATAMAQAKSQSELMERRVTLPPIETLTMNIPKKASPKGYRFPSEERASTLTVATALEPQNRSGSIQGSSISRDQRGSSSTTSSVTWPATSAGHGHRPTLSDPSGYLSRGTVEGSTQKVQYSNSISSQAPAGARPIIFSAQSTSQMPAKTKSKAVKKRKKSLSDKPSQDYRRSLTHGLLLTEPIRRDENPTTSCVHCGESSTPEWRRGPYGNRTLCNACGLFYRKLIKKFGTKDANMLMRFKKQINPEDRRVPSILNIPAAFISNLDNDSNLDVEYNTIGGTTSSSASGV